MDLLEKCSRLYKAGFELHFLETLCLSTEAVKCEKKISTII